MEDYFLSEISILGFPLWPQVTSLYVSSHLLLCTYPRFTQASGYSPLLYDSCIIPVLSILPFLHLGPHDPHSTPPLFPGLSAMFLKTESQPSVSLTVHIFCLSSKLPWSYCQNTQHFGWKQSPHHVHWSHSAVCKDLESHVGLTRDTSHPCLSHSLSIHSQASSSSTRSCPESFPSFSEDNHVYFTGTLPNMCDHMSSVSCSHHDISLHSPHCSPYPFQPTFRLLPRFHLSVSLEASLCSSSLQIVLT